MKKSSFLIAGKHAVTEAIKNPNRKILRVFLTEESKKNLNREIQDNYLLRNIKFFYKTKKELDKLCSKDQITHQGLIAEIEPLEEANIKIDTQEDKNLVTVHKSADIKFWVITNMVGLRKVLVFTI